MVQQRHYFFALSIPQETKHALKEYCNQLKASFPFARWVHEEDFHITLAFLGHALQQQLKLATELVSQTLHDHHSFPLMIDSFGTFGQKDSPRIFWSGVQREERLYEVRNQVFTACTEAGFKLETRPFHPHITVARKWQGEAAFPFTTFEKINRLPAPLSFQAKEIVLYQTHLDQSPKYESIASFNLQNNGSDF